MGCQPLADLRRPVLLRVFGQWSVSRFTSMRFLLLNGMNDNYWKNFLAEVLQPLGTLSVACASQGVPTDGEEPNGLIIIDATMIEEAEKLISRLRAERPERRIVVLTASPTWEHARAAFEAGAADYLPKTLTRGELLEAFQQVLRKPLPPWHR